jgi:hypothetical protein
LTFYEVTNAIKESEEYAESDDLQEKVTELEDNFAPFINYCDSWFSNCFDELDFDSDNIVEQAISLLE